MESLTDPSPALTNNAIASSSILTFSRLEIFFICSAKFSDSTLLRSKRWHLDKIVTGIFLTSVVAKINFTCSGGSSNVFNKALNALLESICTSSIIKILNKLFTGLYFTLSIISRTSSTPVLLAASISITSKL